MNIHKVFLKILRQLNVNDFDLQCLSFIYFYNYLTKINSLIKVIMNDIINLIYN